MTHDDSIPARVTACAVTCQVISGLVLAARFYSRGVITRVLASEDYCNLAAWFLALGYTIPSIISACVASGLRGQTVPPEAIVTSLKADYIGTLFYQLSLIFAKSSICLLYIRVLFSFTYARRAAIALLVIVITYGILGAISTGTLCRPLKAFWDHTVKGECHPDSFMWAAIGLHIATDFLIFLLPIPVVLRLSLPLAQRISLLMVFALGFIACLISILRAVQVGNRFHTTDPERDYVVVKFWTLVEINIAILIPCLLVLKPLLAKIFPYLFRPQPSHSPEGAPRTIGSDPLDRGPAEERAHHTKGSSEKPSVYQHENQSGDSQLLGYRGAV